MDTRQCMIVDLEQRGSKRMFITERVFTISESKNGLWAVRFFSSPHVFNYNRSRLLYLTHPETIDLGEKGLYINNKHINNVTEIIRFSDGHHTFYRITYKNGYYEFLESSQVYITRTPINKNGGSTWEYLCQLAAETGLTTEDDENILSKQYALVDIKRDNVPLAQFLGDKRSLSTYRIPCQVYYPFGCNASQKNAVEAALTHQVSIIQGPPGTGKTQTILNIIANLIMAGKTVLVVSNNNSAVDNIAEKMAEENLGFIVAKLGSTQNKEAFAANQPIYPDMTGWATNKVEPIKKSTRESLLAVSQGFDNQLRQAELKSDYDALVKEATYHDMLKSKAMANDWLNKKSTAKLIRLRHHYQLQIEKKAKTSFWFRLKWAWSLGMGIFSLLKESSSTVIARLEAAYYQARKKEIEQELVAIESMLHEINITKRLKDLRTSSLQLLKNYISRRYSTGERPIFSMKDIKLKTESFLKEYPVVLSTTYSAKSCIDKDMVFDYMIMDEASQVDIKTGTLAFACASNAVIVGDDKQLPNVVSREEAIALDALRTSYEVDDRYNAVTHSFLQSCVEVFRDVPITLLREHYRCHPKIIGFCNQRFYQGELIAMTTDRDDKKVLKVVRTVPGNHARGHFNQREIDEIVLNILPQYANSSTIGIITPYRLQATTINEAIGKDIASTVHKYQGRECDTIIISLVDNNPTDFSDDPNLLNVAISRAKKCLCIVTNGNDIPAESNIGQLISYIQYNNFEITESKIHSVFDLLYQQYTDERLMYEKTHTAISEHLSENLLYEVLTNAIKTLGLPNIHVICHYPLSRLIANRHLLDDEEKTFADSPFSHVDFLIYNGLTKMPLFAIEVDGWRYHQSRGVQQTRDNIKDRIFAKLELPLIRISTTDTINEDTMKQLVAQNYKIGIRKV